MQKVMYVIDSLQTGGAEKSLLDISSRLKNFNPVVCHIYRNEFLKSEFQNSGIKVISLNVDGPYNFKKAYKKLKAVLLEEKPGLVVGMLLRSELLSRTACRAMNIPNLGTFVSDPYSKYALQSLTFTMKIKIGFFWLLNMVSARYCTAFLSNSESIKISNCKALLVPAKKVKVIYRGRRTDIFKFNEGEYTGRPVKFLFMGRLLYSKGLEELLIAFSKYSEVHAGAILSIAGEGPYQKKVEQLIQDNSLQGSVRLLGNIKDVNVLMHNHDIFVFPSHYEGFSGSIIEAMLSGLPVLASDISMNQEAVEHMKTGYLFPVNSSSSIQQAMIWATRHPDEMREFSREARKVAEKRFDIDLISFQHDAFYEEILADWTK